MGVVEIPAADGAHKSTQTRPASSSQPRDRLPSCRAPAVRNALAHRSNFHDAHRRHGPTSGQVHRVGSAAKHTQSADDTEAVHVRLAAGVEAHRAARDARPAAAGAAAKAAAPPAPSSAQGAGASGVGALPQGLLRASESDPIQGARASHTGDNHPLEEFNNNFAGAHPLF